MQKLNLNIVFVIDRFYSKKKNRSSEEKKKKLNHSNLAVYNDVKHSESTGKHVLVL